MTPERRAVEAVIRTEVDNARVYLTQGTPSAVEGPLARILVALDSLSPKPSESSMVQRIEALEDFVRRALPVFQIEVKWGGCAKCDPGNEGGEIFGEMLAEAKTLLDGPPDPERDRETRAEVERP